MSVHLLFVPYSMSTFHTVGHFRLLFCVFFVSFINSKTIGKLLSEKTQTIYLLNGNNKGGVHSWTYLFNGWSSIYGLPHGKNVSSVNAVICIATHSGSHSSHGPTSPMVTLMRAIACHKRRRKCRHVLQSTWCASPICIQQPYRPGTTCLLD